MCYVPFYLTFLAMYVVSNILGWVTSNTDSIHGKGLKITVSCLSFSLENKKELIITIHLLGISAGPAIPNGLYFKAAWSCSHWLLQTRKGPRRCEPDLVQEDWRPRKTTPSLPVPQPAPPQPTATEEPPSEEHQPPTPTTIRHGRVVRRPSKFLSLAFKWGM